MPKAGGEDALRKKERSGSNSGEPIPEDSEDQSLASAALKEEDEISQQKDETKGTTENGAIPKCPKSPDAATLEKILTSGPDTPL